jgi:hypothetical protein
MLHSSFRDAYKGRIIQIRFDSHPEGFTAKLQIDGNPTEVPDKDRVWSDRKDAIVDVTNIAHEIITSM